MNALRFFKILSIALSIGIPLAACGPSLPTAQSSRERVLSPNVGDADFQALVDGNNAFALDLYQALRASEGNLFYSPFSISIALAMTYGGARGDTASQMADVLHFNLHEDSLHAAFDRLDLDLAQSGKTQDKDHQPLQLNIANAVWAQQNHPFLEAYLDLLALNYGAGIHLADFTTQADKTRKEINRWVSDQTQDRIQDIISPGALDDMTRMVLVNAIYFKGDWLTQFDANDTYNAPFHLLDGSDVKVEMMSNDSISLLFVDGDGYQAVELPYDGRTAAMDIILPDEGQFEAFDAALDWPTIEGILGKMQSTEMHLNMPKFTFRNQFNLSDQLAGMGMPDASNPDLADFSGMDGMRDLYISNIIHQALVAVDEKGTEAAAATVVIMTMSAMPMEPFELTIDRPFFFIIRHLSSRQILFAGRVMNPAE